VDAFNYLPPFQMDTIDNGDGTYGYDPNTDRQLPFVFLVYEQSGEINPLFYQSGCDPGLVSGIRASSYPDKLQADYDLIGPVAGTVIMNPYCGQSTNDWECRFTNCVGFPFPANIPGLTDSCDAGLIVEDPNEDAFQNGWYTIQKPVVPDRVFEPVPSPLVMDLASGRSVKAGEVLRTSEVDGEDEKPSFRWNCDPDKLYMLFCMDNDGITAPNEYFNWWVYNIPGCDVANGDEAFSYLPPFRLEILDGPDENGNFNYDPNDFTTPTEFVYLVYEQPGQLTIEESAVGCDDTLVGIRSFVRKARNCG